MRTAVTLMYVGAALTVLSTVLFIATADSLKEAVADARPGLSPTTIDVEINRQIIQAVVRGCLGLGLWVWMAVKNGDGRKWARVVATVLAAINVLLSTLVFALIGVGEVFDLMPLQFTLTLVVIGLAAPILILLYGPNSSRYYDEANRWQAAMTLRGYY